LYLPAITVSAAAPVPAGFIDSFVYPKLTAIKLLAVCTGYGSGGFFFGAHFDESETFGLAC